MNAWLLAVGALVSWPFLLVASAAQLLLVISLAAKFIIDGCDISRPLSRKTVYWAVGTTVAFIIAIVVVGVLLDSR